MLNVGLSLGYIYGTVNHAGSIYISSGQGQNTTILRAFTAKGLEANLGVQYLYRLNARRTLLFGAIFSPETPIAISADNLKYSNTDTISVHEKYDLSAPTKLGFCVSYLLDRKTQTKYH